MSLYLYMKSYDKEAVSIFWVLRFWLSVQNLLVSKNDMGKGGVKSLIMSRLDWLVPNEKPLINWASFISWK
jgi:hypothetical protein